MAEGTAVSAYGTDLSGTFANRPTNAPAGITYWATDTEQFYVSQGGNVWSEIGTPAAGVGGATIAVGTEAANVINVAIQLEQPDGTDLATIGVVDVYLSDDSGGDGVATTAPTGGIAIGTDGAVLASVVTNKVLKVSSESDGDIDLDITDTGTPTFYLVVVLPNGEKVISGAITFA